MGPLRRWAQKRTDKVDRARVKFFQLEPDERAIEAWPFQVISLWPGIAGVPQPPTLAHLLLDQIDEVRRLPLESIVLLTDARLMWSPYRSFEGHLMYKREVDNVLAEGAPLDQKKQKYGRFHHPALGTRQIPLQQISQVNLVTFALNDLAVLNIYFEGVPPTDSSAVRQLWPTYDMRNTAELAPQEPNLWEGPTAPLSMSFLQMSAWGAATLNLGSIVPAFETVEIAVRTDSLQEAAIAEDWSTHVERARGTWQPIHQRL